MKNKEIKELTDREVKERYEAEKANLTNLKLNHAISPLDNPMSIKAVRKNIARLATELRQREISK